MELSYQEIASSIEYFKKECEHYYTLPAHVQDDLKDNHKAVLLSIKVLEEALKGF